MNNIPIMKYPAKLQTRRLQLEPITAAHSEELCELFSDAKLHEFVPFEVPSLVQQQERCARWAKGASPDGTELWFNWAGRDKETGKVVAHFQAGVKASDDKIASIGYVVGINFQRRGIASEGLSAIFEFLKNSYSIREVRAWSDTRNVASHRLAEKLGMKQVEVIKNADFFKGQSSDEFVYSLSLINDSRGTK